MRFFSLSRKAILMIVGIALLISVFAVVIYNRGIGDVIRHEYEERSTEITRLVAAQTDAEKLSRLRDAVLEIYGSAENRVWSGEWGSPEFNEYTALYSSVYEMEEYGEILSYLRRMQDAVNADCLYIIWPDAENDCYVYLVDAALEEPCPVGCIDPIYTDSRDVFEDPSLGFKPTISNTPEYGWLLATGMPVFDSRGGVVGYATVDISMNEIMAQRNETLVFVVLMFLVLTFFVSLVAIFIVNRSIVRPINMLSKAAGQYSRNRQVFSELNISGGDEIGMLAKSMAQMEKEINGYISNLEKTTGDLIAARELAARMDRAANVDALTKVRNKRAYDVEAERLNAGDFPYGLLMIDMNGLKLMNDSYGHEMGDESLKNVCRIICRVFRHSPVFRVGGDEFIVVLEGSDFEEREQLMSGIREEFEAKRGDESLEPWERVSAAVGCAVCDRAASESADSVLKRADKAMYDNKCGWKRA